MGGMLIKGGKGGFGWRWTRAPAPMRLTLCNGVPTFDDGKATDARPGALIAPAKFAMAAE